MSSDLFKSRLELYARRCPPSSELHALSRQLAGNISCAETNLMTLMTGLANATGSKEVVVSVRSAHNYLVLYSIVMIGAGAVLIGTGPVIAPFMITAKVVTGLNGLSALTNGVYAGLHLYEEGKLDGVLKIYNGEINDVKKQIEDLQFLYCASLQPIKDRCWPLGSVPQFCEDRIERLNN